MNIEQLIDNYLALLWTAFQYDYDVFSKPWLYAWLVPVFFYLVFFIVKWVVLTLPVWLPCYIVLRIPLSFVNHLALLKEEKSKTTDMKG